MVEQDEIRTLAYQLWEADGRPEGQDSTYWLRAEAMLTEGAGHPGEGAPSRPPLVPPRRSGQHLPVPDADVGAAASGEPGQQ